MGALDEAFREMASALIDAVVETPLTYFRATDTYDSSAGSSTRSVTSFTVKATPPTPFTQAQYAGGAVLKGDLQLVLSASLLEAASAGFVPRQNDYLEFGGRRYAVISVEPYYGGDQVAAYALQVRA